MTQSTPFAARRLLLVATALLGATAALPSYAAPPPWAPAHGQRAKQAQEYRYVYYPAQQVYYAPANRTWFWLSGSHWQFGLNLPPQYRGYAASGGVPVLLHSRRPYVEHVYVEQKYGRPWRAQHRPQKPRHHDQDRGHGPRH